MSARSSGSTRSHRKRGINHLVSFASCPHRYIKFVVVELLLVRVDIKTQAVQAFVLAHANVQDSLQIYDCVASIGDLTVPYEREREDLRYIRVRVRPTISGFVSHSPAMCNRTTAHYEHTATNKQLSWVYHLVHNMVVKYAHPHSRAAASYFASLCIN